MFESTMTVEPTIRKIDKILEEHDAIRMKGGNRYRQYEFTNSRAQLDLFLVHEPVQWGVAMVLRTGPAKFSKWVVTQRRLGGALPSFARVRDGGVYQGRKLIEMPQEIDFLNFLGIGYEQPWKRFVGMDLGTGGDIHDPRKPERST